jgi:hypothetical protein
MRAMGAMALAATMFISNALAATDAPGMVGPLAPGKPAGVKQADIEAGGVMLVLGVLGLAAGIALLASTTQGKSTSSTGTSS